MPKLKPVKNEDVKPGMIVRLPDCPNEKYEVIQASGSEKVLVRREDLE